MKCKHVIHIDAPSYDTAAWKVRILQCLKMSENSSLKSISFPALGTGILSHSCYGPWVFNQKFLWKMGI